MKTSPVVIVFATVFIDLLGFGIVIPLLPFYAETFGATAFTVGLLGSSLACLAFGLGFIIGPAVAGPIAVRGLSKARLAAGA